MKKLILFFAVVAGAVLTTGCEPPKNAWVWIVENNTEQLIKFEFPYSDVSQISTIIPGGNIHISMLHLTGTSKHNGLRYDDLFEIVAQEFGENVSWQILSENDEVLKTWNYSAGNLTDQRFFDESSWTYEYIPGGPDYIAGTCSWTFEILPEDIQSEN